MIVYSEEIKLAPEGSTRYSLTSNKITLGMMALAELRKIWAASSWTYRLFEFIIKNKFVGIGKPEISVSGGGAGVAPDSTMPQLHPLTTNHPSHGGMHPPDDSDFIHTHSQVPELIIDPELSINQAGNVSGVAGPVNTGMPPTSGMPNSMLGSAAPTPGGSMHPVYWNPANADTMSPDVDAAGYVMWNGQNPEMMQGSSGPEGWGFGGMGGDMADGAGEDAGGSDVTWMAMNGLAGNMPFNQEGGPAMGAGGAIGYAGAADIARMTQGTFNPAKMGPTVIDLWNILGLGDSSGWANI
ncbi:hypothetical protein AA313_de0203969 [Arthrobotrys entomopaga]|nr:hypothetical protein AA313_de0203969 [Arthrobotrys entomopaga]